VGTGERIVDEAVRMLKELAAIPETQSRGSLRRSDPGHVR